MQPTAYYQSGYSYFTFHYNIIYLHFFQRWTGAYFVWGTLNELGLHIQLGHSTESWCFNPRPAVWNFTIIHTNGLHHVALNFWVWSLHRSRDSSCTVVPCHSPIPWNLHNIHCPWGVLYDEPSGKNFWIWLLWGPGQAHWQCRIGGDQGRIIPQFPCIWHISVFV